MFLYSEFTQKIDSLLDTLMYGNVDNKDVFYQAFVHRSALNEYKKHFSSHNERLEFLGDAILEFVISERLFHDYPNNPEGWMTDVRSSLVR